MAKLNKTTKKHQVKKAGSKVVAESPFKLQVKLKANSYETSMKNVRKHLDNNNQRTFSSFIHARGMDSFNDLVAKTLARPRCILGGSISALTAVTIGIYLSKYYGYSYNYLLLFLFFVFGYIIVLIFELIIGFFIRYK